MADYIVARTQETGNLSSLLNYGALAVRLGWEQPENAPAVIGISFQGSQITFAVMDRRDGYFRGSAGTRVFTSDHESEIAEYVTDHPNALFVLRAGSGLTQSLDNVRGIMDGQGMTNLAPWAGTANPVDLIASPPHYQMSLPVGYQPGDYKAAVAAAFKELAESRLEGARIEPSDFFGMQTGYVAQFGDASFSVSAIPEYGHVDLNSGKKVLLTLADALLFWEAANMHLENILK